MPLMQAYLAAHGMRSMTDPCGPIPQIKRQARTRMMCNYSTPPPEAFRNWDVGFSPGNDFTGVQFGGYYADAPVAFHPSLGSCVGRTAHDLVSDATTLAAAVQNAYSRWQNNPNAAQMEEILSSYAAGEIGAIAFIAGTVDFLGVVTIGLIIAGTGLTLYSLISISECMLSGNATGFASPAVFGRGFATA